MERLLQHVRRRGYLELGNSSPHSVILCKKTNYYSFVYYAYMLLNIINNTSICKNFYYICIYQGELSNSLKWVGIIINLSFNMKKIFRFQVLFCCLFCMTLSVNAQILCPYYEIPPSPSYGNEELGILCHVSVDLNNDPVTSDGYLKYTIPAPTEQIDFISGPASAFLINHLGDTVDFYVRKNQLELAAADYAYARIPYLIFVKKWINTGGVISLVEKEGYYQCYYVVYLEINNNV